LTIRKKAVDCRKISMDWTDGQKNGTWKSMWRMRENEFGTLNKTREWTISGMMLRIIEEQRDPGINIHTSFKVAGQVDHKTIRYRSRIRPFSPLSLLCHSIMADKVLNQVVKKTFGPSLVYKRREILLKLYKTGSVEESFKSETLTVSPHRCCQIC